MHFLCARVSFREDEKGRTCTACCGTMIVLQFWVECLVNFLEIGDPFWCRRGMRHLRYMHELSFDGRRRIGMASPSLALSPCRGAAAAVKLRF
jgi:hypothetical protein